MTDTQAEALRHAAWCLGPGVDTLTRSGLWTRHDAQTTQRDVALQLLEEATPMILCDASNPGTDPSGLYECPYNESVDGYRHGFMREDGYGRSWVKWTRAANHPADPRCPECAAREATP